MGFAGAIHFALLLAATALYYRLVRRRTALDLRGREAWVLGGAALLGAATPMALAGPTAGLSLTGALLGLAAAQLWAPSPVKAGAIVAFPWLTAGARVACWYRGCCFGCPSVAWLAVAWGPGTPGYEGQVQAGLIPPGAASSAPVFPTQAAMVAFALLLGGALEPARRRRLPYLPGAVAALSGVFHLWLETQRVEPLVWGSVTAGTPIDVALVALGSALAWREARQRDGRRAGATPGP